MGELSEATCRDWFPKYPSRVSSKRTKALVREHYAIGQMRRGADRQQRQAEHDRAIAAIPSSGAGAQLDVVINDPHRPDTKPLWIDTATVLPMAVRYRAKELQRAKEFALLVAGCSDSAGIAGNPKGGR